jgi:hypothetical protein
MYNAPWFFKRQTTQEQIVDQTENRGVCADRQGERDHSDDGESGCFGQASERVFKIGDHNYSLCSLRDNDGGIVFIRHEVR